MSRLTMRSTFVQKIAEIEQCVSRCQVLNKPLKHKVIFLSQAASEGLLPTIRKITSLVPAYTHETPDFCLSLQHLPQNLFQPFRLITFSLNLYWISYCIHKKLFWAKYKPDCGRSNKNGEISKKFEGAQDLSAYKAAYPGYSQTFQSSSSQFQPRWGPVLITSKPHIKLQGLADWNSYREQIRILEQKNRTGVKIYTVTLENSVYENTLYTGREELFHSHTKAL